MTTYVFRNPDLYQLDELRELIRGRKHQSMPGRGDGFVVEDLDLVIRWYGRKWGLDGKGRYRLCEVKHANGEFTRGQSNTFGLIAQDLQSSKRFDGFYIIRHSDGAHDQDTTYEVNGARLTCDGFLDWVQNPHSDIPGLWEPTADNCSKCRGTIRVIGCTNVGWQLICTECGDRRTVNDATFGKSP